MANWDKSIRKTGEGKTLAEHTALEHGTCHPTRLYPNIDKCVQSLSEHVDALSSHFTNTLLF